MLSSPRIIAIDDDLTHLRGLADGLNSFGAACLAVHFKAATEPTACPHVRVIFADLHLTEGSQTGDHAKDMGVLGGLIEQFIRPTGPYMMVLWTRFPEQADTLQRFLDDRLKGVTKPFAVTAIDKAAYLDGNGAVKDASQLVGAIKGVLEHQPHIAAFVDWEERIQGAASDTVCAIMDLIPHQSDALDRSRLIAAVLWQLAAEAVGNEHVAKDPFRAVNEALLPILADRVAVLKAEARTGEIWAKAVVEPKKAEDLSLQDAARLNRLVHVADGKGFAGSDWGVVIPLPAAHASEALFESTYGLAMQRAAKEEFGCKDFVPGDPRFRWVLVQIQAACDFAQRRPGPLPYLLGLEMPAASLTTGKLKEAVWQSPLFELNDSVRLLNVNSRFPISFVENAIRTAVPLYRLREQLLAELIYRVHASGSRPGKIWFNGVPPKPAEGPSPKK